MNALSYVGIAMVVATGFLLALQSARFRLRVTRLFCRHDWRADGLHQSECAKCGVIKAHGWQS